MSGDLKQDDADYSIKLIILREDWVEVEQRCKEETTHFFNEEVEEVLRRKEEHANGHLQRSLV